MSLRPSTWDHQAPGLPLAHSTYSPAPSKLPANPGHSSPSPQAANRKHRDAGCCTWPRNPPTSTLHSASPTGTHSHSASPNFTTLGSQLPAVAEAYVQINYLQICTSVHCETSVRRHMWSCAEFSSQTSDSSLPLQPAEAIDSSELLWPGISDTCCLLRDGQSPQVGMKPSAGKGRVGYTKIQSRECPGLCFALIQTCWTWFSTSPVPLKMPSLHLVLCKEKNRSKGQAFQCVLQNRDFYMKRIDRVWKYINMETRTFYLPARKNIFQRNI